MVKYYNEIHSGPAWVFSLQVVFHSPWLSVYLVESDRSLGLHFDKRDLSLGASTEMPQNPIKLRSPSTLSRSNRQWNHCFAFNCNNWYHPIFKYNDIAWLFGIDLLLCCEKLFSLIFSSLTVFCINWLIWLLELWLHLLEDGLNNYCSLLFNHPATQLLPRLCSALALY